jgi:VWFA-related protein
MRRLMSNVMIAGLVTLGAGNVLSGAPAPQSVFRSRAEVVVIDVAVAEGRTPITTLTKDDFELRDNGIAQQILDFGREALPLDVTITVDISGSMTPPKRTVVERAIGQVSAALRPDDRGAVVTFGTHVAERTPLQRPPLAVNLSAIGNGTAVYDALLLSLVTPPLMDRRQVNLFMTDGEDTTSSFDAPTVVETARHANGQVSIVLVRDNGRLKDKVAKATFDSIARMTGGEVIELDRGEDLSRAFLTAIETLRTSYVLRYSPAGVSSAGWHDVTVTVRSKKYSVRARKGYWADAAR